MAVKVLRSVRYLKIRFRFRVFYVSTDYSALTKLEQIV